MLSRLRPLVPLLASLLALALTGGAAAALAAGPAPGTVSGTVYYDTNGNGHRDPGEPGLGGVTVFLDLNHTSAPAHNPQDVSAADGTYKITSHPEQGGALREVPPPHDNCTNNNGCFYYPLSLSSGQHVTGKNFGNVTFAGEGGPPPPQAGKSANAQTTRGVVTVQCPGQPSHTLSGDEEVQVGCTLDATNGHVELTWARGNGKTEIGELWAGAFVFSQERQPNGLYETTATLTGGEPLASCAPAAAPRISASRHHHRRVHVRSHGHLRSHSHESSAASSATEWLMEQCGDGTLTKVFEGVVRVTDFGLGKVVFVKAGQEYFARAFGASDWHDGSTGSRGR